MATTQNTFNGNGSNLGPFSFTFKWLESTDIKVSVGGVLKTAGTHYNLQGLNYTTKTGGQVLFTAGNAPPVGTGNVRVYRDTDDDVLSATFSSGSAIRAKDLNDNFTQNLYVTQEVNNNAVNVDGSNPMVGNLNMNGFQIDNLAAPTSANDAANKAYVDALAVSGGDGDKGDITVSGLGSVFTIDNGAITNAKVNASAGIVSSKLAFTQTGSVVQRTVESKLQDVVSVKDFGAVGNGATNDKAAIIAADTYAASVNKTLFFPAGTYLANDLTINCDWLGEEGSVILNDGTSTTYNFVRILSQSNVTVERLTFDGAVSADPPSWNSSNYNSFTGAVALHIFNSSSITVRNCTIRNSVLSPLRIDTCSSVLIDGCTVTKGRGNFGDCIYIRASNSSSIVNTVVSDATRACIVTEAGSHSWLFSNVRVSNAHDAGINYGGTEYNSGFWFENSANHVVVGCKATATRTGFLISTGTVAGVQSDQAHFQLNGCVANSNVTGYNFQSKAGQLPIDAKLINCQSWNSDRGFHFEAKQTFDTFTCVGCHAEIAFTAGIFDCGYVYDSATITYPATFTFTDCTTSYKNYDQADLNSTSSNSADFSTATAGKSNITIRNCRNLSSEYPVVIKGRVGDLGLDVSKSYIDIRTFANADLRLTVEECEVAYASISGSGTASISNSLITGPATIGVTGEIRLTDCSVKPGVNALSVLRTLNDKKPALEIRGCRFEKDIATSDYVLRIQEEGTNKPIVVISDCTFFNSGAATSTNPFIWVVRVNTPISYFDNISDNNVTNLLKTNTSLSNPASGDTKLLMH